MENTLFFDMIYIFKREIDGDDKRGVNANSSVKPKL